MRSVKRLGARSVTLTSHLQRLAPRSAEDVARWQMVFQTCALYTQCAPGVSQMTRERWQMLRLGNKRRSPL